MKEVIDYYNNGQDEFKPKKFIEINGHLYIDIKHGGSYIGFYEWLFNPKYKVFEVIFKHNTHKWGLFDFIKSNPQEILDYLKRQVKK